MQLAKFVLGLSFAAAVGPCHVNSAPISCQIDLKSQVGGRLEVVTMDSAPNKPFNFPPLIIVWHPPASGTSIDLAVNYPNSTLEHLNAPSITHARFKSPNEGFTARYVANVSSQGGQWVIDADQINVWPFRGDILFLSGTSSKKAIDADISAGGQIKITIVQDGNQIAAETFNSSATGERDRLLASARELIQKSDPSVCRPM